MKFKACSNLSAAILIFLFIFSCKEKKGDKLVTPLEIELIELDISDIDTTNFMAMDEKFMELNKGNESIDNVLFHKGATWKLWRNIHKECVQSDWLKKAYYFGVTSTVDLGSIVNKDFFLQRVIDENSFSKEEIKQMFNYGAFANCDYTQDLTMSLDVFVRNEFGFGENLEPSSSLELTTAIKKASKTTLKIDSWRLNNLIEQRLIDFLNDGQDDIKKKRYYETLKKDGNLLLAKVVEIKGFSSKIILEKELSADLVSKIGEGIIGSIGNTGINSKFSLIDNKTIEVKSDGKFYVFGQFKKLK